ncbi:hypothetical protein [Nonomuraea cavernae]|uniref:Uncharacterized protein n=1 Tax=Nonomuraea cavernae TaxID=2045107 RepID=A0A917Z4G8_9ACTN|nr:hypothetical protein [Nonomuraea cavernae]MCA2187087.1 hypothetical protein [Nonomuraea cavernae]GGO74795.1 hypothetical protein GCM10012289_48310 [Nonomuraea cavernae]
MTNPLDRPVRDPLATLGDPHSLCHGERREFTSPCEVDVGKKKREYGVIAEMAGTLAKVAPPVIGAHTPHPVAGALAGAAITAKYGDKIEKVVKDVTQDLVDHSNKEWEKLTPEDLRQIAITQQLY